MSKGVKDSAEAVQLMIELLASFSNDDRHKVIKTVQTFYDIKPPTVMRERGGT